MANFNKVMLMGNLTRDPEIKYTPKGMAITQLGLAVNRVWSNEAGERQEEVTFIDVEMFGRKAEVAAEYLKKGRPVFIEGRLKLDTWDDKTSGQKRSKLKVVGENMEFIGGREAGGGGREGGGGGSEESGGGGGSSRPFQKSAPRPAPPKPPTDPDLDAAGDDDIPF